MSDLLRMRDYQQEAVADLRRRFLAGDTRVPSVLATGLGKTVIFAHVTSQWEELRAMIAQVSFTPGRRVLVLAHRDELVLQAARKIKEIAPHLPVGIVKAEMNQVSAQVIVASVQTLRSAKRRDLIRQVGLIIIDECHHATAVTYRKILYHFGAMPDPSAPVADWSPRCLVAGFTATLARSDKQKLSEVWQECTFKRGPSFGIRRGYLLDVRGRRIVVPEFDLGNVKRSGGDYAEGALAEELDRSFAPEIIAQAYAEHAPGRKGLVFVPTVDSAYRFAEAFERENIRAAVVFGKLAREERRLILKKLAAGDLQVVVNCAVLTEGFDDPTISCVVIARPTRSAPLYQQMVGRGLRPDLSLPPEERGDCLVLDVVGASRAHDLRSLVDLSEAEIRDELDEGDLSLLEMEEEEARLQEEEGQEVAEELYVGATAAEEFDPLGRTTIGAWLQTRGGTYFLPAGTSIYILLAPSEEPGMWDVAWLTTDAQLFAHTGCESMGPHVTMARTCMCGGSHTGAPGAVTEHRGLSLEAAIGWAEETMEFFGYGYGKAKAGWRRGEPSEAQKRKARRLGIVIPEGEDALSKGELGDMITTEVGSRRIDPVIRFMRMQQEG